VSGRIKRHVATSGERFLKEKQYRQANAWPEFVGISENSKSNTIRKQGERLQREGKNASSVV